MTAQPTQDMHDGEAMAYADADGVIEADRDSPAGTPRWVKAAGIIVVVLLLLFAGLHLTGNAPTHLPGSSGAQHGLQQAP